MFFLLDVDPGTANAPLQAPGVFYQPHRNFGHPTSNILFHLCPAAKGPKCIWLKKSVFLKKMKQGAPVLN